MRVALPLGRDRALGREGIAELIARSCGIARQMARRLAQEPGIGVMNDVILDQVAIRFGVDRPTGAGDALTRRVIEQVQADGICFAAGAKWKGTGSCDCRSAPGRRPRMMPIDRSPPLLTLGALFRRANRQANGRPRSDPCLMATADSSWFACSCSLLLDLGATYPRLVCPGDYDRLRCRYGRPVGDRARIACSRAETACRHRKFRTKATRSGEQTDDRLCSPSA